MATQRLTMKNIREILRQKWALDRTHRDVALSLRVSAGVVGKVVGKAGEAGLTWADVEGLSDEDLARVVYDGEPAAAKARPLPDFAYVHTERRRKGVTLALLHVEYVEKHPSGYRYTQFCDLYRAWLKRRGLTMRIEHFAGDKAFVDYSGTCWYDPKIQRTYAALGRHRHRQVLPRLRLRPARPPAPLPGDLPPHLAALRRAGPGPRRRHLC